jgi:hypothetical protein
MEQIIRLLPNAPIIPSINTAESPALPSTSYPTNYLIEIPVIKLIKLGSPSDSLGSPSVSLGSPSDSLGSPSVSLGSPSDSLGSPSGSLGSPSDSLGSPSVNLESPSDSLESPSGSLESPSVNLESPSINLENTTFKLDAIIEQIKPGTITYSTYLSGLSTVPTLPDTLDLRNNLGPIRNQGPIGSCVGFGVSCMKEWQAANDNEYNGYLSPAFIYINRSYKGSGMLLSNACDIMASLGTCHDETFPYSVLGTNDAYANTLTPAIIPDNAKKQANQYRVSNSVLIRTVNDLKTALYLNGPCPFAAYLYGNSSLQFTIRPRMWAPIYPNNVSLGGHCMCFVGYNSNGFIVRNSWGTYYNPLNSTSDMIGYDYLPYADFTSYVAECWSSTDLVVPKLSIPPSIPPSKPSIPPSMTPSRLSNPPSIPPTLISPSIPDPISSTTSEQISPETIGIIIGSVISVYIISNIFFTK